MPHCISYLTIAPRPLYLRPELSQLNLDKLTSQDWIRLETSHVLKIRLYTVKNLITAYDIKSFITYNS